MARRWKAQRHTAADVLRYQAADRAMAEGRQKDVTEQQWWLNLTNVDRANLMNAFEISKGSDHKRDWTVEEGHLFFPVEGFAF